MRLGLSTSLDNTNAASWAKAHAKLGCKSVVFPLDSDAPAALIKEYADSARENDLLIAEVGIWRNAISPDPAEAKRNLEYSIRQLALADEIGARCCVNVAGSTGRRWDGGYKENFSKETRKKTIQMVQTIIDEVNPQNTYFTLEPMPWMIPSGPEDYLQLIEEVGRERFAVHMDIINMINSAERYFFHEEFLHKTFELLGKYIKSCHLKDVLLLEDFTLELRECACGEGTFNLEEYVRLANALDPHMPMIIEHLKNNDEYIESFAYVKKRLGNL